MRRRSAPYSGVLRTNPYTLAYWFWAAVMVCVAVAAARLVGWGLTIIGVPTPFPAVLGIVAGIAAYVLLYRLIIRWAARPELQRELAERAQRVGQPGKPTDAAESGRREDCSPGSHTT